MSADNGLSVKSLNPDPEKTLEPNNLPENAEIIPQMDEIIKNNDKFETIRVIMEILCKELAIPVESGFNVIAKSLNKVWEDYYKSMEDWKDLRKTSIKKDIRQ